MAGDRVVAPRAEDVVDLGFGEQLTVDLTIEIDGVERPGCVAQALFRHYPVKAPD